MITQTAKLSVLVFTVAGLYVLTASTLLHNNEPSTLGALSHHNHADKHPADSTLQDSIEKIVKSEEEWREILTDEEFYILRENGTEAPFQNEYFDNKKKGTYVCAACGNPVYSSETKFKSGTGWPSFYAPIRENAVGTNRDKSFGMVRTEVHCNRCGGHLGHIFRDGPEPTGLRHCINSAALDFKPAESSDK